MHEFVLCRVELEPSPTPVCFTCISMKQEVIYPSAAATSLSVSLSLSVQQTLISLPSKVTDSVFSSSKLSAFPFICTWERPWPHTLPLCVLPSAHGPPLYKALFACVCQCVSVWVGKWTCMSTLCVYVFLTLCLTSSVFTFMNRCMQFFADSPRCTAVYLNCCTSGSLSILWCFLRSSLCCRSITGSCFIPERVRVHLVPVWIGLQGNEWLSLLLKDGLRGIKHPSFASFLTLRSKKVFFSFFFSVIHYSGFLYSPSSLPCLHIMSTGVQIMHAYVCKNMQIPCCGTPINTDECKHDLM